MPPAWRARATAVWAAALGGGVALGPLMSAALTDLAGRRAPYVFVALAGAPLAVLARARLPEARADKPRRIDFAGTLLLGLGIAARLSGFVGVRTGWSMQTAVLLAAGLVLLVAFVAVEWRSAAPMLDLGLFRRPDFIGSTLAALVGGAGVLSLVSLPTLLERAIRMPAFEAAAILLGWSATSVASAFGVRWRYRARARTLLILGLLGSAAGELGLYGLAPETGVGRLLPPLLVAGIAYGILNSALGRQAIESVPADRVAMRGGANNTARYLGSAMGLTIVTVIVTYGGAGSARVVEPGGAADQRVLPGRHRRWLPWRDRGAPWGEPAPALPRAAERTVTADCSSQDRREFRERSSAMPHGIVKLWPGKSEAQKTQLADRIARDVMTVLDAGADSVSVAIEEVSAEARAEQVYKPDIAAHPERLYKKPGYRM